MNYSTMSQFPKSEILLMIDNAGQGQILARLPETMAIRERHSRPS
jgi:hypothetical protein